VRRSAWALVLALLVGCSGRRHLQSGGSNKEGGSGDQGDSTGEVVEFDLSGGVQDSPATGLFFPIPASRTYVGLIRELERDLNDKKARSFFVRLGDASLDWAHSEELGLAFLRLREKTGRPVVCHAHSLDNATSWFVMRACSRIWVSPAGDVNTVGIAGQVVYLKAALDKLKITADFVHMGRYKSAVESLTREGPSDEAREALTSVLGSIRSTWLDSLESARKEKNLASAVEDGPFSATDAKERGLIDDVGYEDQARRDAQATARGARVVTRFGAGRAEKKGLDVSEILRTLTGADDATGRPHIVVVPAEGAISMDSGGLFSEAGITAKVLQRIIRRLASDDTVKAVVLRIDSPGGSALASDLIWHDLMELRKKKPLVASVGEMAASGGYYLACAANKVIAERTSIIGSIGVLGGKIVVNEALANFGIHAETVPASSAQGAAPRAAYLSPLAAWDDPTRERVRREMEHVYDLFVARVAEGRGLPEVAVRAVAEGRIWSGLQGERIRLIDELGGLGKAIDIARRLADVGADTPLRVEGVSQSLVESLLSAETSESSDDSRASAILAMFKAPESVLDVAAPLRPFISSIAPLIRGENVVLALPFAFHVE
jgi:protease-4